MLLKRVIPCLDVDKGRVVKRVIAEEPESTVAAFLGDDLTDEDGFRAVQSHGIGVLVREESRPTAAQIWLKPPTELIEFLNQWISIPGGEQ